MLPIDEILGAELLAPERQAEVVDLLKRLALPPDEKRKLYGRWAKVAGITLTSADMAMVAPHGTE